jgi:hypothetical protein
MCENDCVFERRRLKKRGQHGQATVIDVTQHPKIATNDWRKYDFIVDVRPAGDPPFRTELQETFLVTGLKPRAGDVVPVIFDPSSHDVMFDLDGDSRYDLDALKAEQQATREHLLREPPLS